MIGFLTIIYGVILYALVHLKVVPWNTFWKISPAIWAGFWFVVLFIPMNWGAPTGSAVVIRYSVPIVPNVAGEVIDVPVKPNTPLKKDDILFRIDPVPYEAQVRQFESQIELAELRLQQSTELQKSNAVPLTVVQERQSQVNTLRAQLDGAKYNLDKTVVRAPSNGFVTNVGLRKGARVAAFPTTAVMAFIETDETIVGAQIHQSFARYVAPGQPVEIAFKFLPGKIYTGHIAAVPQATSLGQGQASGLVASFVDIRPVPFPVRIALDDPALAMSLPAGSTGEVAIYTDNVKLTHIIRRVMIRMSAYLNYVIPF